MINNAVPNRSIFFVSERLRRRSIVALLYSGFDTDSNSPSRTPESVCLEAKGGTGKVGVAVSCGDRSVEVGLLAGPDDCWGRTTAVSPVATGLVSFTGSVIGMD